MSLHEVEPQLEKHGHSIRVFDAFRDGLDLSFLCSFNDLADSTLHFRIRHQGVHQFAVEFYVIRLQDVQNLESFLIDAVVFECETNTKPAGMLDESTCLLDVLRCITLGNLYDES